MKFFNGALFALAVAASATYAQPARVDCVPSDPHTAGVEFRLKSLDSNCLGLAGGFTGNAGSFGQVSTSAGDLLGLHETLELGAAYGVRLRQLQFGFTRPFLPDNRVEAGFTIYGQRFHFNQDRDASILAFDRDLSGSQGVEPDAVLNYVSRAYGATAFLRFAVPASFSHLDLTYNFDVTGVRPLTPGARDYFSGLQFLTSNSANRLSGIRTSKVTAAYRYSTVNHPIQPTRGTAISASIAFGGLGGDVNLIESVLDARWFHPGPRPRHVIAMHLRGSTITGYGGKSAPPFDRYYLGGEDEVRGFPSWSVSPTAYVPGVAKIQVLNDDGSPRNQHIVNGTQITSIPVIESIPVYWPLSTGGDTKVVANLEYRIPVVGPLTLVLFTDMGVDKVLFVNQVQISPAAATALDAEFPELDFKTRVALQPRSQSIRMSSGVELQVFLARLHAPVRLSWAYNVLACSNSGSVPVDQPQPCSVAQQPIAADRSLFPNYATFLSSVASYGQAKFYRDPRPLLRFAIGLAF